MRGMRGRIETLERRHLPTSLIDTNLTGDEGLQLVHTLANRVCNEGAKVLKEKKILSRLAPLTDFDLDHLAKTLEALSRHLSYPNLGEASEIIQKMRQSRKSEEGRSSFLDRSRY